MEQNVEVKVTRIATRWHARLWVDGKVHDEMACQCREDIGFICRTMLRWFDKMGGVSAFAHASRHRQASSITKGRIWWGLTPTNRA